MVGQHGFYARPSAHLLRLVTRAGLGRITRSSGIVRHGSVVKTFRWATMTESDSDDFGDMKELFASMANRPLVRVITPDAIAEQPDSELEVTMFDIVWGARGREPLQILDKLPDGFSVARPTKCMARRPECGKRPNSWAKAGITNSFEIASRLSRLAVVPQAR